MPIRLPVNGTYNLKFFCFYNCYQRTNAMNSDCRFVEDRLTIYIKSNKDADYLKYSSYDLHMTSSTNYWQEYNLELDLYDSSLFVNIFN